MNDDQDTLELTPDQEAPEEEQQQEELVVTIGEDEPEPDPELPDWVKDLRRTNREKDKRIKELEAKIEGKPQTRAKPTLEGCDYDNARYEREYDEWKAEEAAAKLKEEQAKEGERKLQESWQTKLQRHEENKKALNAPDIAEAEEFVQDVFDQTQQALIVSVAENSALLGLALKRNPKKARELAAITFHPDFVAAIVRTEMSLKVAKKGPPPPEKRIEGAGSGGATDNTLDKLREKAAKTGDYSEVIAYKRKKKQAA